MQEIKQMGDYCPECSALAAKGVWEDGTHRYRHNGKHELTIECRPLPHSPAAPPEDAKASLKIKLAPPEARERWEQIQKASAAVDSWPAVKRAEAANKCPCSVECGHPVDRHRLVIEGGNGRTVCDDCQPDAKALEDAIEQLTRDANFAEAIGQASDRAFAADLRTVINAARSREQYATKQIQIQTPRIKAEAVREFIEEVEKDASNRKWRELWNDKQGAGYSLQELLSWAMQTVHARQEAKEMTEGK